MKAPTLIRFLAAACIAALLAACAANTNPPADALALQGRFKREEIHAGIFVLTAFSRITRADQPLDVYIEGDGFAYRSRYQPSDDPTPHNAQALAMAAVDQGANVVYLARPCQFTPMARNPDCAQAYWTGKRSSEEVVASMDAAVTHYLAQAPGQRVNLVGYSGGGAIAVLIAARRNDVASIRTVAGNLDHVLFNRLHGTAQMPQSLNAIDYAQRVATIAQLHVVGADDTTVPPVIAQRFVRAAGSCATGEVVAGMAHDGDWAAKWPALLAVPLRCTK